jgi:transposase-like protein
MYDPAVNVVGERRLKLIEGLHALISQIDTQDRSKWRYVVEAAFDAGVSDEDIRRELGTSPSTVYRWRTDDIAPRAGTRRLMKGALLKLIDERIGSLQEALTESASQPELEEIG